MNAGYLLLIGAPDDLQGDIVLTLGLPIPENFAVLFRGEGIRAYGSGIEVNALAGNAGIVLGSCEMTHVPASAFDGSASAAAQVTEIFSAGAAHQQLWGSFISCYSSQGEITLYRSPFSTLSAFWRRCGKLVAVSNDALLLRKMVPSLSLDERYLVDTLISDWQPSSQTSIAGLNSLGSGEALILRHPEVRCQRQWDPLAHVQAPPIMDVNEAVELLRRYLKRSISLEIRQHGKILLDYSGGLDSSLIASLLADHPHPFTAVNYHFGPGIGDERDYARAAMQYLGGELIEQQLDPDHVDLERSAAASLPHPYRRAFVQGVDCAAVDAAARVGASRSLNGAGGDNVFAHLQSSAPLADALRNFGPGPFSLRVARDIANAADASVVHVMKQGMLKALGLSRRKMRQDFQFLSEEVKRLALTRTGRERAGGVSKLGPGKQEHLMMMNDAEFHLLGFDRGDTLQMSFPLLAQPLIEICLRIPSWMWVRNGINRSLIREAFSRELPPSIKRRGSKGGHTDYQYAVFRRHRAKARELLMEGHLARMGIVDRASVEIAFRDMIRMEVGTVSRLMRLIDYEAWLSAWRNGNV
ncbi:asparagine synthase-related protein [Sphingobium yanoikuyae]|uniref:asparagine synthase-related protein n=1 Tax=Sphingobium yanoikuyae TaxID=13690 RepID=UPI0035B31F7A